MKTTKEVFIDSIKKWSKISVGIKQSTYCAMCDHMDDHDLNCNECPLQEVCLGSYQE